jgi:hypothetical protein
MFKCRKVTLTAIYLHSILNLDFYPVLRAITFLQQQMWLYGWLVGRGRKVPSCKMFENNNAK